MLDGARVLRYALFTGDDRTAVVIDGLPLDRGALSRLVIAEDLIEGGVFLMHCNDDWQTVAASHYPDARSAEQAAGVAYAAAAPHWTTFRALTPEEEREVETTRAFLREIAAEYPDE
jgi:hypothetical protein